MTRDKLCRGRIPVFLVLAPKSRHLELRSNTFLNSKDAYGLASRLTKAGNTVYFKMIVGNRMSTVVFPPKTLSIPLKGIGRVPHPVIDWQVAA